MSGIKKLAAIVGLTCATLLSASVSYAIASEGYKTFHLVDEWLGRNACHN